MSTYIIIKLTNFMCWTDKTIKLVQGINLLKGKSGQGKTTICKALHFVLYGGRKWKEIQNYRHKQEGSGVSFHFVSPNLEYNIIRTRPPETLIVYLKDINGVYELRDQAAQSWINSNYGEENSWLAASYISRKRSHFLLEANNNDKMELLQRVSFGDISPINQPEFYLEKTKNEIMTFNERLKKVNETIKIQQSIKASLFSWNQSISGYSLPSDEEILKISNETNSKTKEIDILNLNLIKIQSRRQLKQNLQKLKTFDYRIDEIDEKLKNITMIKRKFYLYKHCFLHFDKNVLDADKKELEKCNYLFSKYIEVGWDTSEDINIFLSRCKKDFELYESRIKLEQKNKEILESNRKKEELNKSLTKAYNKQMDDYNRILTEIKNYKKRKEYYTSKSNEYKNEVYLKLSESDDMSSSWIIGFKLGISMSLKELICPNCNHGLIYDNGKLILGTIIGSEDETCENIKKKYNEKLSLADIEYQKRKERETFILEYNEFSKIIPRDEPNIPEEPKLLEYEKIISFKPVTKPKLDSFDIPSISYSDYKKLWRSLSLIEEYNEYLSIDINIDQYSIDNITTEEKELLLIRSEIKKTDEERSKINSLLDTLPEDYDIESEIMKITDIIKNNNQLLSIYKTLKDIQELDKQINTLTETSRQIIEYLEHLDYYYNKIENLGVSSLQEKIEEVNSPLKIILDDLFDDPIDVRLSSYKQLKNGDTKLQINFQIDYKGMSVGNMGGFSDGEEGRLSIALLMAFSRMNNNPLMIIDEVLSSVDDDSRLKCLEIIDKWTPGKFVIHICHSIADGHHYNVENF